MTDRRRIEIRRRERQSKAGRVSSNPQDDLRCSGATCFGSHRRRPRKTLNRRCKHEAVYEQIIARFGILIIGLLLLDK